MFFSAYASRGFEFVTPAVAFYYNVISWRCRELSRWQRQQGQRVVRRAQVEQPFQRNLETSEQRVRSRRKLLDSHGQVYNHPSRVGLAAQRRTGEHFFELL